MKDFGELIRDFTLIDFLGILFPGSVVILLIQMDYNLWGKLEVVWGDLLTPAVRIALVLVSGYFVGTLLMEIGDLWEYAVWGNAFLNPRSRASVITGLYERETTSDVKRRFCFIIACLLSIPFLGIVFFAILYGSGVSRIMYPQIDLAFTLMLGVSLALFTSLIAWLHLETVIKDHPIKIYKLYYIQGNDSFYMGFTRKKSRSGYGTPSQSQSTSQLAGSPALQIDGQNEKQDQGKNILHSKRTLFDGFRIMSRNILLVSILLCFYAKASNRNLHNYYQKLTQCDTGCWLLFGVLLLLFERYWRFSYLKYKYSYEVFIDRM